MTKVQTSKLKPGMVVGSDVLNYDNKTILSKGQKLSQTLITRLELYGILSIYVEDEVPEIDRAEEEESVTEDLVSSIEKEEGREPSHYEKLRESDLFKEFQSDYEEGKKSLEFHVSEMVDKNVEVDPVTLLEKPLEMIAKAGSRVSVIDMLHAMRGFDDSTFTHCMNVALLNYVVAGWLRWNQQNQELAMMCGILFDIGKIKVPRNILNKKEALTDDELKEVRRHAEYGFQILKDRNFPDHIKATSVMHHERFDGSGYPFKLRGDKTSQLARLTAVCDVYDAMTSARVYRDPICPFRVVEIFEDEGLEKYDPDIIMTFLKNVTYTYIQNSCKLSDGREGVIIMLNPGAYSRPVVKCGNEFVDLSKHRELRIEELH